MTIGFDPEFEDQMGLADNSKTHSLLQKKLAELGRPGTMVKFVVAEAPRRAVQSQAVVEIAAPPAPKTARNVPAREKPEPRKPTPGTPPSFNKEDFKNDPLIKKALEVFKGQIVDIRG